MIGLAFDENFNNDVLRGLLRRNLRLNGVRIQDAGLRTLDDETVLEWAAQQGRVLITHDVSTMTTHAYARVAAGRKMPGVFEVPRSAAIAGGDAVHRFRDTPTQGIVAVGDVFGRDARVPMNRSGAVVLVIRKPPGLSAAGGIGQVAAGIVTVVDG